MRKHSLLAAFAAILFALFAQSLFAQAVGNGAGYETPDQAITAGAYFDQNASPQIQGDINYSHHVSSGVYSYNDVRLTSISFTPVAGQKLPKVQVQTQTETGFCTYIASAAGFAFSGCAAGGLAATPGQSGASGSGNIVALRRVKWKDLVWGFNLGPSYSAVTGGVDLVVGIRIGWAK